MSKPTSKSPNLNRVTQKFIDDLAAKGGPALYTLTPQQARQVLIDAQSGNIAKPDVDIKDFDLPVGPQGKTAVRMLCRKNSAEKMPILLYIHGGGWIMGNKQTHDRMVRQLAAGTGAAVVYVDYVNSPESQYPDTLEQCYAVLEHMVKNADEYNLDSSKIIVEGDSAGGNMAIATAILAKQRKGPQIGLQVLFYPVTNAAFDTDSYQDFADGPWLTLKAMQWFWNAYCPDEKQRAEITVSPLRATADELKGLPQALIFTAENDVLRDEGEAFARKLDEAGVKVASIRVNGSMHDFAMLDGLADSEATKTAMLLAVAAIKKYIKGKLD